MSKIALDLLKAISFLTSDNAVADIRTIPATEIAGRLRYYHKSRVESADNEAANVVSSQLRDSALVSSLSAANAVMALGSKLLVHQALVVDDPLFPLAAPIHEHTKVERQAIGMPSGDDAGLLNLTDPTMVFRVRTENAALIERFRLSLREVAGQLQGVAAGEFTMRAQQLFEREIRPQIAEVNAAATKVVEAAGKGLLQTGGGLLLALLTGSALPARALLLFAANGIIGEAIPAVGDYIRSRKKPEFIWGKLMG